MLVRMGTLDDFDEVLKLQKQLEDTEVAFDENLKKRCFDLEEGKNKLRKRLEDEKTIFLVAVDKDNNIVGFIDGNIPDDEWWYKDIVAYLNHLCVDSNFRNQGIAQLLLNEFTITIKNKGAKYIRLLAFPNNIPAINFYKKNSFKEYSVYYSKEIK